MRDCLAALLPAVLLGSLCLFRSSASTYSTSDLFVGHPAPDFTLKDLDAQELRLSSLKGKIIILDFWASWCAPCRAEIPAIQRLSRQFAKKDAIVIGVNSGEAVDVVRKFVDKNKLTYPIVLTNNDLSVIAAYRAEALPTVVVIDKNGIIAAYRVGENPNSEQILAADILHVASSKYVSPKPIAVQMAQAPPPSPIPLAAARSVGPDVNWHPKTADEFLARGYVRLQLRNISEAKADAEEALKLHPSWPMAIFLRGRASYEAKDYASAVGDFDEVIRQKPDWPEGYHYRGLAYSHSGQHQKAVPDYEKSIGLNLFLAAGYNDFGWALTEIGDLEKAKTNLDKAVELEPDYIRARENRVILFGKQNNRAAELSELTIILAVSPNDQWARTATKEIFSPNEGSPPAKPVIPEPTHADVPPKLISKTEPSYSEEARRAGVNAVLLCSLIVNQQGVPENIGIVRGAGFGLDENAIQAVSTWRFVPASRQGLPVAQYARIAVNFRLLQREREHENQIASLNFTLPPGGTRPELARGHIPENLKDATDARVRVALSVRQDGEVEDISVLETTSADWGERVTRELKNWRFRPATVGGNPVPVHGVFEVVRSSNGSAPTFSTQANYASPPAATVGPDPQWRPKTVDEFLARGYTRLRIHKYPQSAADAEDALKLMPDSFVAKYLHGRATYEEKDYPTAIQDFTEVIQRKPDWAEPYRYRGLSYSYSGQHQKALGDYQSAIKLNPYESHAYNALGWAYGDLGDSEQAKTNLDRAIDLQPDFVLARENRAKLLAKTGQLDAERQELTVLLGLFPNNQWAKDTQEAILQKEGGAQPVHSPESRQDSVLAPKLMSPEDGAIFNIFPRRTTFEWQPCPGAASYILEWDFSYNGIWAGDAQNTYGRFAVQDTHFAFDFVGAQPGRWRVAAVDVNGLVGRPSEWRTFRYLR